MERLRRILKKAKNRLFPLRNVVGVGLGYKETGRENTGELSVVVFVSRKEHHRDLGPDDTIPRTIDAVPTDVVEIGEVKFLVERTGKLRPAKPGISIGHQQITAGTLGALVRDNDTGEVLILSNNHVLANSTNGHDGRAALGDMILQPGPYDGGTQDDAIAVLHRFVPINAELRSPECAVAKLAERIENRILRVVRPDYKVQFLKAEAKGNLVDCAVAKPLSPRLVSPEIVEIGYVNGVETMKPGLKVQKSARTTGLTRGEIKTIATTLRVQMAPDTYAIFTDQAVADLQSAGGDSGSLVLDEENNAVGLLFAGSDKYTIINQINYVLDQLGVSLVTGKEDEK
ncbi:MAG TPA: hypothetical protein GX735_01335 [Firmicutes bacterium]|jgi:hypothetical protein|nr:hypothetical protein [Bacillota bacterium]